MPFPENLLAGDERVVKHLHPHWLTVFVPTVLFILVVGVASFLVAVIPEGEAQDILRIVVLALAVIVLILLVIIPVLRWRTTHYVITTHRVMVRTGILSRHGKDIGLTRITDVSYTQSLWDRIIGAGTLTIESAGEGPPQVFRNIPNSDDTQQLINHLVEEGEQSRARDSAQYLGEAYRDLDDEPPTGRG
ncbi:MAG: PH domain-containing protein [Actinomycetota bacterium]|nr:PH domain-containing protein [Actinomycetota bacterium]